jgi:hypothetical protein
MTGRLGVIWRAASAIQSDGLSSVRGVDLGSGRSMVSSLGDAYNTYFGSNASFLVAQTVSPNGQYLATGWSTTLLIYSLATATQSSSFVRSLQGTIVTEGTTTKDVIKFSPDGTKVGVCTGWGLEIYGLTAGLPLLSSYAFAFSNSSFTWHPDSTKVALTSASILLFYYLDVTTSTASNIGSINATGKMVAGGGVEFNADGSLLACWAHNTGLNTASTWGIINTSTFAWVPIPDTTSGTRTTYPMAIIFHPNNLSVIVASQTGTSARLLTSPYSLSSLPFTSEALYSTSTPPTLLDNRYYCAMTSNSARRFRVWDLLAYPVVDLTTPDAYGPALGTGTIASVCWGPYSYEISNRETTPVVDSLGNPVNGARVFAKKRQTNDALVSTTTTDASGRFSMYVMRNCEYTLAVLGSQSSEGSFIIPRISVG